MNTRRLAPMFEVRQEGILQHHHHNAPAFQYNKPEDPKIHECRTFMMMVWTVPRSLAAT